jgi:hypothetical protein
VLAASHLLFKNILHSPKTVLAAINQLKQYASLTMKKYICILVGAALLAACEQKTETAAPATTPAPTSAPAAATEMASPAATESPAATMESPAQTTESPAETTESPVESPAGTAETPAQSPGS